MSSSDKTAPLANNNDHFDHHNDSNTSPEDVSIYLDDSQQQLLNTSIDSCNHNGPTNQIFAPPTATTTTTTTSNHIDNHTNNQHHHHHHTNGYGHDDHHDVNGVDDYVEQQYDLNDSNLSNKPLHLKWNFRQPIIGPNG
jgi:hypothetical protein